ncbi:MAG: hypothetical protein IT514_04810 [Burkholderiales bacterium]|nr:hypothetical protein [Burkholderiales bacterium]
MKTILSACAFCVAFSAAVAAAQDAPGAQDKPPAFPQRRFEPPPVPEFMLRPPAKPLTMEEKLHQAEQAAERARRVKEENEKRSLERSRSGSEK